MQHIAQIEPHLFLGSSFSLNPEILQQHKITYIFHFGFEIAEPILATPYFRTQQVKHEYFDLEDNSQSVNKMLSISDYVVKRIHEILQSNTATTNNENVCGCCVAGKSRSASMIALYLHYKYPHLSYDEIINNRIKKYRSIAINMSFADAIRNKIDHQQKNPQNNTKN